MYSFCMSDVNIGSKFGPNGIPGIILQKISTIEIVHILCNLQLEKRFVNLGSFIELPEVNLNNYLIFLLLKILSLFQVFVVAISRQKGSFIFFGNTKQMD